MLVTVTLYPLWLRKRSEASWEVTDGVRSSAEDCVSSSSSPESKSLAICSFEQDSKSSVAITLSTPTKNAKPARRRGLKTLSVLAQDADSTCPLGLQLFSLPQFPWMASIT